jgi:hypothetical protein
VKFLPEIRQGRLQIERLYFLLPLFLAMLALPLLLENQKLDLPSWLRQSLRLAVIPLALTALSPVWTPAILLSAEFRLQTCLALIALSLSGLAPLFHRLPLKPLVMILAGTGIAATVLPWRQFNLVQASISEAYHEPILLGWGWWLTLGGTILTITAGLWAAFTSQK